MLQNYIIKHCAPTLAGLKTANIFMIRNDVAEIIDEIRKLNALLTKKGLRIVPIRNTEKGTLIYLYRPDRLVQDLSTPKAVEIMEKKGYPCNNPMCCLAILVRHLMNDKEFPHEIGLFLGYPPSDVEGFINSPEDGVKCCGCWKVYHNEEEAKKIFESYRCCTAAYCKADKKGKSLEALIVDTTQEGSIRANAS